MAYKNLDKRREYQRKNWRKYYKIRNPERRKSIATKRRHNIKEFVHSLKREIGCKNCGENHPACLQFHHIDPSKKETEVGRMIVRGFSIDRIKREIDKCDVLCANCHMKFHWNEKYDKS